MFLRRQHTAQHLTQAVAGQFSLIFRVARRKYTPCARVQYLSAASRIELTQFLWQRCLLTHAEEYAAFVTRKLITLAVRAACLDWQAQGGELIQTTQQLLQASGNPTAVAVGLATVSTLVDEVTGTPPRIVMDGLLAGAQAKAVYKGLSASLVAMTAAVCSTMQAAAEGAFSGVAPATPASAEATSPGGHGQAQRPPAGFFSGNTDATSVNYKLAARSVGVLSSILSEWGLGLHVSIAGLNTVLALVSAGLRASHSSRLQTDATLAAVNCIIDMVRTPRVPPEFGALFGEIASHMLRGVEHMLLPSAGGANQNIMSTLPEEVSGKFAEFVGTFVQHHAGRFEAMPNFNMTEFVSAFFGMTVALADTATFSQDGYLSCVAGWNTLIERLLAELGSEQQVSASSQLYMQAMESLANKLFDGVRFSCNGDMLSMLEDGDGGDSPDDAASLAGSVSTVATSGSVRMGMRGSGSGFNTPTKRSSAGGGYAQDLRAIGSGGGGAFGAAAVFGSLLQEEDDLEEGCAQAGSGPGAGGERPGSASGSHSIGHEEVQSILQQVFGSSAAAPGSSAAGTELDGYLTQCLALLGRIGRLPNVTASLVQAVLLQLREVAPVAKAAVDGSHVGSEEHAQWAVYDTATLCALMAALAHVWTDVHMQASPGVQQSAGEVLMLTASLGAAVGATLKKRSAHSSRAQGSQVSTLPMHLLHRLQRACFTCLLGMLPWLDAHLPGQSHAGESLSADTATGVLTDITTLVFSAVDTRGAVSPPADSTIASAVALFSALGQRSRLFVTLCSELPLMCAFVSGLADITAALPTEAQAHLLAAVCTLLFHTSSSSSDMGDSQNGAIRGVLSAYTSPLSKLAGAQGTADSAAIQAAVAADRSLPAQLKRTCIILSAVVRALGGAQGSGDARARLRDLFMPVVHILLRAVPVFLSPSTSAALMARRHARSPAPEAPSSIAVTCLNTASSAMRFIRSVVKYLGCVDSDMPGTIVHTVATPIVQALRLGLLVPSRSVGRGRTMSAPGAGAGSHSATKVLLYFLRLFGECAAVVPGKDGHSQTMITLVNEAVLQSGLLSLVELGHLAGAAAGTDASAEVQMDLSPALHLMLRRHIVTHWRGLAHSIVKGGQFRSPEAAGQVQGILQALQSSMTQSSTPPALVRLHLVTLHSLQAQHRAFSLPDMRAQVLPELLQLIMGLQLQRQAALLTDELQQSLWELLQAAESPADEALRCIQMVLADMAWLQADHMQQLNTVAEASLTAVRRSDAPGFATAIASICSDLRVWSATNADKS